MVGSRAIISTAVFALFLVAALIISLPGSPSADRLVHAEFKDAFPLVPDADVRMFGAKIGSVRSMTLTDHGTVDVTIALLDGVSRPREDASASVRAGDLLGSTYLALSPGNAPAPLNASIPLSRTFVATSLQDFFNSYDTPTRNALQLMLVELGSTLESRGADLNKAVLELAPAIRETTRLTQQVSDDRAHLSDLITSAHTVTQQVAPRSRDLELLIDGMHRTFGATAANAAALDRGLQSLPPTLAQTDSTLARLQTTATAAQPLAQDLGAAAPDLAAATQRLGPFADDAGKAMSALRPLVRQTGATLAAGARSFPRLATSLRTLQAVAPALVRLGNVLDPLINMAVKGSFGGLGRLAGEPGTQKFENAPGRNWFRGIGVLGCETFGVPTAPGCLANLLAQSANSQLPSARSSRTRRGGIGRVLSAPTLPTPGAAKTVAPTLQRVPILPPLPSVQIPPASVPPAQSQAATLLKYLLGP